MIDWTCDCDAHAAHVCIKHNRQITTVITDTTTNQFDISKMMKNDNHGKSKAQKLMSPLKLWSVSNGCHVQHHRFV